MARKRYPHSLAKPGPGPCNIRHIEKLCVACIEWREALQLWIDKEYFEAKVQKFIGKISNGFDYWFTFIINPGVEATNNRAERALRPQVVLRKIMGTQRNEKGTSIHERIMTALATWEQRGLNSLQMLTGKLAS